MPSFQDEDLGLVRYSKRRKEPCKTQSRGFRWARRRMFGSVVTCAKVTLVFLNIWVLAVVLVISLGHWRVFETHDNLVSYDNSHLIVMRELKEEGERKIGSTNNSAVHVIEPAPNIPSQQQPVAPVAPKAAPVADSPSLDTKVANMRHWCQQQHPAKIPYDKIPASRLNNLIVDQKHKLLFCQIPGVAITEWRKLVLILNGKVNASSTSAISGGDVFGKYASSVKRLMEFNEKERAQMLKDYLKVLFVRDPLERLVVAYKSKIQSKAAKYFHRAYGTSIIKRYRKDAKPADIKAGSSVKFSEFAQYIIDNEHEGVTPLNEQWEQYYKQCHPCLVDYDFVGTFENVEKDTAEVLKRLKADKAIKPPYIYDTAILPQAELTKYYKELKVQDLQNLFKVFAADYTLFGYQCPKFLHELLEKANIFHDY